MAAVTYIEYLDDYISSGLAGLTIFDSKFTLRENPMDSNNTYGMLSIGHIENIIQNSESRHRKLVGANIDWSFEVVIRGTNNMTNPNALKLLQYKWVEWGMVVLKSLVLPSPIYTFNVDTAPRVSKTVVINDIYHTSTDMSGTLNNLEAAVVLNGKSKITLINY